MHKEKVIIVWLRNDLRLHDNETLWQATQDADRVIPVYVFDPFWYGLTSFGFPKTGAFRARFIRETVKNLRANLRKKGADLFVRSGDSSRVISELAASADAHAVYFQTESTPEEQRMERNLEKMLRSTSTTVKRFLGHTLYHLDDLPFKDQSLPDVFTAFRKEMEKHSSVRNLFPIPERISIPPNIQPGEIPALEKWGLKEPDHDERTMFNPVGGEDAALQRLQAYFWEHDLLKVYKETRNGLLGEEYSSKFSPWLACGALSPRYIYWQVKRYEKERAKNISTYWLIFELLWRDFFRFQAEAFGALLFNPGGIHKKKTEWNRDREVFQKWAIGVTGIPFIDANMRELNASGFMSNRGRQNVASFLAHNLNIDWRMGAEYFESCLVDYDVCSNWGNWAYIAGVGQDPRSRYFDITKQAYEYDPHSAYIKHWLPELKKVPNGGAQEVWRLSEQMLNKSEVKLGEIYPRPMIDIEESYREIRKRMYGDKNG